MIDIKKHKLYFIFISLLICLLDQFSKHIISINYNSIINKDLIFFTIDYLKNYGAAFNIFSGSRIFLSTVSIIFSFLLIYIILKDNINKTINLLSYSFILGGTMGNGIDRILKGYVVDFINLNFINFAVFNIADVSINIGFILILYNFLKLGNKNELH
jgi:signal peptidase II